VLWRDLFVNYWYLKPHLGDWLMVLGKKGSPCWWASAEARDEYERGEFMDLEEIRNEAFETRWRKVDRLLRGGNPLGSSPLGRGRERSGIGIGCC